MGDAGHNGQPDRTTICLVGLTGAPFEALRYLITHLNELQNSLEFELLDPDEDDDLISLLSGPRRVTVDHSFDKLVEGFAKRQNMFNAAYEVDRYVIVSLARLSDDFYALQLGETSLLALGGWDKSFAPPSLVEYALTLMLRFAGSNAVQGLEKTKHVATRGCLFDVNPSFHTVRLKVLNSFICSDCKNAIVAARTEKFAEDLRYLLGKSWLGKSENPLAPASICRKLGYDLFLTKGIKPSWRQTLTLKLQSDLVSLGLKLFGAVLVAYLLFRLGLTSAESGNSN